MDLRQLEYFETVSSQRSFRQAARVLGLAQPTLSVQIRQLEHELGVPLIDRSIRPIKLTKAGETLARSPSTRAEDFLVKMAQAAAPLRKSAPK